MLLFRFLLRCVTRVPKRITAWIALSLILAPGVVGAYVPNTQDLEDLIQALGFRLERAYIETRTEVYSPLPAPGELEGTAERPPQLQPERGFIQKIYWVRQALLGIETYSATGELLHFYLSEGGNVIQASLNPQRSFALADILPPYLPFVESNPAQWRRGLTEWGISPNRVELVRGAKDILYFRLAEGPQSGLWLDRDSILPVRLDAVVQGGGDPLRLTLLFGDFAEVIEASANSATLHYPFTTNYLLNGRLFRQTRVVEFRDNPKERDLPLSALRKRAQEISAANGGSGTLGTPPKPEAKP